MMTNRDWQEKLYLDLSETNIFEEVWTYNYSDRATIRFKHHPKANKVEAIKALRNLIKNRIMNVFHEADHAPDFWIDRKECEIVCRATKYQQKRRDKIEFLLGRIHHEMENNHHAIGHIRAHHSKMDAIDWARQLIQFVYNEERNTHPIYNPSTRHEYFVIRNRSTGDKIVARYDSFEDADKERERLSKKASKSKRGDPCYFDHYQVFVPLVKSEYYDPEDSGWHIHRSPADYGF